jgi:hypothetical protein
MVAWGLEALYANPLDVEAFGHALATVLLYPRVAAQLARFGSHRARATFTWNGIAQQIVSLPQLLPDGQRATTSSVGPRAATTSDLEAAGEEVAWIPAASS